MKSSLIFAGLAFGGILSAQIANPTQKAPQEENSQEQSQSPSQQKNPVFRVQVVSRTIQAVSYRNRSGWTKVDFQGTALAPKANGQAEVNSRKGYMQVKATVKKLPTATTFGNEYLTYVLWAITPDGRAKNLGELLINNDGNADIDVTTDLQSFGLIVTAEPYFAVTQPSDVVVMENIIRKDTKGKFEEVNAKYQLLPGVSILPSSLLAARSRCKWIRRCLLNCMKPATPSCYRVPPAPTSSRRRSFRMPRIC